MFRPRRKTNGDKQGYRLQTRTGNQGKFLSVKSFIRGDEKHHFVNFYLLL